MGDGPWQPFAEPNLRFPVEWGSLKKNPCAFQHEMYFAACLQAARNPKGIAEHASNKIATGGRESEDRGRWKTSYTIIRIKLGYQEYRGQLLFTPIWLSPCRERPAPGN